jgi:hypothetical protein
MIMILRLRLHLVDTSHTYRYRYIQISLNSSAFTSSCNQSSMISSPERPLSYTNLTPTPLSSPTLTPLSSSNILNRELKTHRSTSQKALKHAIAKWKSVFAPTVIPEIAILRRIQRPIVSSFVLGERVVRICLLC